jgi:hypothetical protein
LLNYRLPGVRRWELKSNRVHLLSGANGTGKSSIAEALELVVTGSVERIKTDPKPDYAGIIRNSESTGAATVKLSLTDGRQLQFKVIATGIEESAMQQSLPVSAFRLDHTLMDQLIRSKRPHPHEILFPRRGLSQTRIGAGRIQQGLSGTPGRAARRDQASKAGAERLACRSGASA